MRAFKTMLKTELKLSLRGMDMLIFAVFFPVAVMIILGIIYGDKPAFDHAEYTFLEQSFGAVSSIGICAAGVMGLPLVISDYRHKKILKRYKVTPVSPSLLLFVQVIINFIYSSVSVILVYIMAKVFFNLNLYGSILFIMGAYLLVIFSIYSIGMMIASVSGNIKTANILCSLIYFPMIIFSGATLPYEVMPTALQKISDFMPLTQGIKLLKGAILDQPVSNITLSVCIMLIISVICIFISIKMFKWE